jgi:hypothetical protein
MSGYFAGWLGGDGADDGGRSAGDQARAPRKGRCGAMIGTMGSVAGADAVAGGVAGPGAGGFLLQSPPLPHQHPRPRGKAVMTRVSPDLAADQPAAISTQARKAVRFPQEHRRPAASRSSLATTDAVCRERQPGRCGGRHDRSGLKASRSVSASSCGSAAAGK